MKLKATFTLVYGIIIASGGIIGFATAGSMPSLISGGVLGLVAIVGAILIFSGNSAGIPLAYAATVLVLGFFAYKLGSAISGSGDSLARPLGIVLLSFAELIVLYFVKR